MIIAQVINVSAPNELVIDKGASDMALGQLVTLYTTEDIKEIIKGYGTVFIVHKKISVVRSDNFKNPQVGDFIR
jgi:hypothetical protein